MVRQRIANPSVSALQVQVLSPPPFFTAKGLRMRRDHKYFYRQYPQCSHYARLSQQNNSSGMNITDEIITDSVLITYCPICLSVIRRYDADDNTLYYNPGYRNELMGILGTMPSVFPYSPKDAIYPCPGCTALDKEILNKQTPGRGYRRRNRIIYNYMLFPRSYTEDQIYEELESSLCSSEKELMTKAKALNKCAACGKPILPESKVVLVTTGVSENAIEDDGIHISEDKVVVGIRGKKNLVYHKECFRW